MEHLIHEVFRHAVLAMAFEQPIACLVGVIVDRR